MILLLTACLGGVGDGPSSSNDTGPGDDSAAVDPCPDTPGAGVFLYTGNGGANWDTNLVRVVEIYEDAGIAVDSGESLPSGFASDFGTLVVLNSTSVPSEVADAATTLVASGGRLVSQTEHGSYGEHDAANGLLEAVGSSMRSEAESMSATLDTEIIPVPPLTDGVTSLAPYYAGYVDVNDGIALARVIGGGTPDGPGDWVPVGYEEVGCGDVVVVADTSMFGYSLDSADNIQFIENFASLR